MIIRSIIGYNGIEDSILYGGCGITLEHMISEDMLTTHRASYDASVVKSY